MPRKKTDYNRPPPPRHPNADTDSKEWRDKQRAEVLNVANALKDALYTHGAQWATERLYRACEVLNGAATPGVVGALPNDLRAALEREARRASAELEAVYAKADAPQTAADVGGAQ